ncbi:hypothetical protein TNCV_386801 [Trichonephila clavipes]|nr:hypothetical protein TNCV_386801 [Trichonephila clavipes]
MSSRIIRWVIKLEEFNIEWEHHPRTQNTVADVLSRSPVESILGEKVNCAVIRDLVLSSRKQLIEEQRKDPELEHIYKYLENPEDRSVNATILVDIERVLDEARRNTKAKNEKWEKYYNRRRRDVQIKKDRTQETVMLSISRYNLRPRKGAKVESQPTIEMRTQQGGPVRSRKSRENHHSPYIEEQARSSQVTRIQEVFTNSIARRGKEERTATDPSPWRS